MSSAGAGPHRLRPRTGYELVAKGIQFQTPQPRRRRRGAPLMTQPADRAPFAAGAPGVFTDRRAGPPQRLNVERFFHPKQPRYSLLQSTAATESSGPQLGPGRALSNRGSVKNSCPGAHFSSWSYLGIFTPWLAFVVPLNFNSS